MIGTADRRRMARQTSTPSMSGRPRSSTTRSGRALEAASTPSEPLAASFTLAVTSRRASRTARRICGSSSMTRTRSASGMCKEIDRRLDGFVRQAGPSDPCLASQPQPPKGCGFVNRRRMTARFLFEEEGMRMQSIIALAAVMAIAACDAATNPKLGGLNGPGGPGGGTNGGNNATQQLVITPNLVQLTVGTTFQLSTNATAAQQSQIQWSSLAPAIATVTQAGVVSAVGSGTTTIVARFSFDTTNVATATIIARP